MPDDERAAFQGNPEPFFTLAERQLGPFQFGLGALQFGDAGAQSADGVEELLAGAVLIVHDRPCPRLAVGAAGVSELPPTALAARAWAIEPTLAGTPCGARTWRVSVRFPSGRFAAGAAEQWATRKRSWRR